MPIRTQTLNQPAKIYFPLTKVEFNQGEDVKIRLTDTTPGELNGAVCEFFVKKGLAMPGASIASGTNLLSNTVRTLSVVTGFASFTIPGFETVKLTSNDVFTLQIWVTLSSGVKYIYGTYELRVREAIGISLAPTFTPISLFQPTINPDELWLDPTDSATITVASGTAFINQINDKTGNTRHATATGTAKPVLDSLVGINGRQAMYFDGIDDILTLPNLNETAFTKFFVVSLQTPNGILMEVANSSYILAGENDSCNVTKATLLSQRNAGANWGTNAPNPKIICWKYGGTNATHTLTVNGGPNLLTSGASSGDPGIGSRSGATVIGSRVGGLRCKGFFGDIMNYARVLDATETASVLNFLNNKYNQIY